MENTFTKAERETLLRLTDIMLEYNKKVNLTAITERHEIEEKHYLDCVKALRLSESGGYVPRGTSVVDVGSGAGFPGVLWGLVRPDLQVTLLDSLKKRVDYLEHIKAELSLDYTATHGRSEELSHAAEYRDRFGVATARAVANMPALIELCLPLVKVGGFFIALKTDKYEGDITNALGSLGGELADVIDYRVGDNKRRLYVIAKNKPTEKSFPRKRVNITKNPII
ncbi:MAG: 16S rRNA (guanine(527)-N(7))-methyltransferase RsmG [Oscillospiraceae bacterium]|jgi:16S rRNA (guanine527-N7)-methyltransferase|nr:16S rRNA (guanine(527)-N(7))-methyltransferase RsmG [Oscillospiraceae bacterium]